MNTRWIRGLILGGVFGMMAHGSMAEDMKNVVILNFPGNAPYKISQANQVVEALKTAGFTPEKDINISLQSPTSSEEAKRLAEELSADVVIDLSVANRAQVSLFGTNIPVISSSEIEAYIDPQGMPKGNVTGVYSTLEDMVYNSYKFLRKIAPIEANQQAVFLENPRSKAITGDDVKSALERLGIPLKAIIQTPAFEDWQEAILQANDDPEIGWTLFAVPPSVRRDGSPANYESDVAAWLREHIRKPHITYWEAPIRLGVLCGFGFDTDEVGRQCGEMAAQVLRGEPISQIPAQYPRKTFVALNRKTADVMGIMFPSDVLNLANVIYHDWEGKEVTRKSGLK